MMTEIAILLSTYNGEIYLEEQIKSIINQSNNQWTLFIRDDGSTDRTISLLRMYENAYENIILVADSELNRGACKSFLWLLDKIEANYYMFCDQDDIWLPNKIDLLFNSMLIEEKRSVDCPIIVNTDLIVANSDLKVISPSFWEFANVSPFHIGQKYYIVSNFITGCTTFFNHKVKEISFPLGDVVLMHDYWIGLKVIENNGKIVSLPLASVIYRQHNTNTLGAVRYSNSIYNKVVNFKRILKYNIQLYKMVKSIKDISVFNFIRMKLNYFISVLLK